MGRSIKLLAALAIFLVSWASASLITEPLPIARIIWQPTSPGHAWLECIATRPNGDLLITRYDTGEIWTVNPVTRKAFLVYAFPQSAGVNSSLGIAEYRDDVFAFNAGQITSGTRFPVQGSWGVWSIDLRNWEAPTQGETRPSPRVSLIAAVPNALALNGLAVLNPATTIGPRAEGHGARPTLIMADSKAGTLYSLDATGSNKTVGVFYSNPELLAPNSNSPFPVGLNGVQVPPVRHPRHIYFTTGFRGTFYRIKLSQASNSIASSAELELIVQGYLNLDDFSLEADGTAYLSTGGSGQIVRVSSSGEQHVILQSSLVNHGTATRLVQRGGKKFLYVNTGSSASFQDDAPAKLVEILLGA